MIIGGSKPASARQVGYIDDLFNHLGFLPSQKRAYIESGYNKKYPDDLTSEQASALIDVLQRRWEQEKIDRKGKLKL